MADSLGVAYSGLPSDVSSLYNLISDNMEHLYTLTGTAPTNNSGTVSLTMNYTYRAFLIWYVTMRDDYWQASGFTIAKNQSTVKFTPFAYASFTGTTMSVYMYYKNDTTVTVLGIL